MEMFKVEVIDKSTRKVIWTETFESSSDRDIAIKQLKENNFNPQYFDFKKSTRRKSK
jgi:hypothetical protein